MKKSAPIEPEHPWAEYEPAAVEAALRYGIHPGEIEICALCEEPAPPLHPTCSKKKVQLTRLQAFLWEQLGLAVRDENVAIIVDLDCENAVRKELVRVAAMREGHYSPPGFLHRIVVTTDEGLRSMRARFCLQNEELRNRCRTGEVAPRVEVELREERCPLLSIQEKAAIGVSIRHSWR